MLCVVQFSDLHFAAPGFRGYGGLGPDTGQTWDATVAQAFPVDVPFPDRVVVTGDIADHGTTEEYKIAAERFAALGIPMNVVVGNHDFQIPAEAYLPSATVSMNRVERHGSWLFVYVDSNAVGDVVTDGPERLGGSGGVTPGDLAWVRAVLDVSDAEHVWLWMHHTPNATGTFANPGFTESIANIVRHDDRIRGVGSGHVHNNATSEVAGVPVYICPSLTLNVDVDAWRTLPPGYREYNFADDGSVVSHVEWVETSDFVPFDLPPEAVQHFLGELSWDEMVRALGDEY